MNPLLQGVMACVVAESLPTSDWLVKAGSAGALIFVLRMYDAQQKKFEKLLEETVLAISKLTNALQGCEQCEAIRALRPDSKPKKEK